VLAKARVCYQERLRCGLQFLSIPPEQRELLGAWSLELRAAPTFSAPEKPVAPSQPVQRAEAPLPKFLADSAASTARGETTPGYLRRKIFMLLAASVIVAAGVGWWQWEQGCRNWSPVCRVVRWKRLRRFPSVVGFEVMQQLLVHKVDPVAPTGGRIRGVAVVSAVIGRDGSVIKVCRKWPGTAGALCFGFVQWWKFEPYRQNGIPVEVETSLAIEFR